MFINDKCLQIFRMTSLAKSDTPSLNPEIKLGFRHQHKLNSILFYSIYKALQCQHHKSKYKININYAL